MSQHFRDNYSSTFYYVVQSHSILKAGRGGIVFNISGCLEDFSLELWPAAFGLPPSQKRKKIPSPASRRLFVKIISSRCCAERNEALTKCATYSCTDSVRSRFKVWAKRHLQWVFFFSLLGLKSSPKAFLKWCVSDCFCNGLCHGNVSMVTWQRH